MIQSEAFGRTFWLDGDDNFKSAPTNIDSTVDYNSFDYVCDWTDWDGVNVDLLLTIYRQLLTTKIDKFYQDRMQSIFVLAAAGKKQPEIQLVNWHIFFLFVPEIVYYTNVPRISPLMRLQSSGNGSMIVDFYPTKSWIDSHIFEDKFLKVLTFSGKTMKKKVVSHAEMIAEISSYLLHNYTAISNNTLPQFIRS